MDAYSPVAVAAGADHKKPVNGKDGPWEALTVELDNVEDMGEAEHEIRESFRAHYWAKFLCERRRDAEAITAIRKHAYPKEACEKLRQRQWLAARSAPLLLSPRQKMKRRNSARSAEQLQPGIIARGIADTAR